MQVNFNTNYNSQNFGMAFKKNPLNKNLNGFKNLEQVRNENLNKRLLQIIKNDFNRVCSRDIIEIKKEPYKTNILRTIKINEKLTHELKSLDKWENNY